MRRDLGNEIVVAIAAVSVIVVAVVFGILLTLPNNRAPILDTTPIAASDTVTAVPPTLMTDATLPPTNSPTPEMPTLTATRAATERNARASETATRAASATLTATATKGVTVTATATRTLLATHTATATRTPSATHTALPSMTRTPTRTPSATHTVTVNPSATFTLTFEAFPNVTPLALCAIPQGWQVYIVKSGDTLSKIAQRVGSTVETLSAANCLVDVNRIVTGDVLYVPSVGVPMGTPMGVSTDVALAYYGCAFPEIATITNLIPGQVIRGAFTLEGTANLPSNFWFYRLEIRPDFSNTFIELERVYQSVVGGALGMIDTSTYSAGLYWVRLMVVDRDWRYPPSNACMIPVYFEPPRP